MESRVKFFTQVDNEAGIASLAVFLYGEGSVVVGFQGEERVVELSKEGRREDYFILNTLLWNGKKDPSLYSFYVDDREYRFGLRNFGLDKNKGFFLNGEHYPLDSSNTLITDDISLLDKSDEEGIVTAFLFPSGHVPEENEIALLSSHTSVCFWGYRIKEKEEEMRKLNSILYSLDKTRATIGVFEEKDAFVSIFDLSVVNEKKGDEKGIVALREGDGFKI